MQASSTETKFFRLYAICALFVLVGAGGTAVFSWKVMAQQQTVLRNSIESAQGYDRECAVKKEAFRCAIAMDLRRNALSAEERKLSNKVRADFAVQVLSLVPAGYVLFIVIRFAMTGRMRPFWPWRLKHSPLRS